MLYPLVLGYRWESHRDRCWGWCTAVRRVEGMGEMGGYVVRGCMAWGHGAALLLCFDMGS